MTSKPFSAWIKEQREKRNLTPSDCMKRVNDKCGTKSNSNAWSNWERRDNKDKINTERVRKVACGLQVSEAEVFAAAGMPVSDKVLSGNTPDVDINYIEPLVSNLPLDSIPTRIEAVLERKGQVILYGPPGTGKTYWAEIAAFELAARSAFGKAFDALTAEERTVVSGDNTNAGLARWCCFHPAYGYEDFLEGYRPHAQEGQMLFELRNGIFKTLCEDAGANPHRNFYLIVDEINRGDIPRIFGELLTILESNKRGKTVVLPLSKTPFAVPKNVYVIGTMNTADRSIALLDAALRRRFGFIELMPDSSTLGQTFIEGIPLADWLDALNARICEHIGRDAHNLQIGHSYFLENGHPIRDFAHLRRVLREDIVPLLEEY